MTTSLRSMIWRERRPVRRVLLLTVVVAVGAATLTLAPATPAAPQDARGEDQPSIEAATLDLDALPASQAASSRPAHVHGPGDTVLHAPTQSPEASVDEPTDDEKLLSTLPIPEHRREHIEQQIDATASTLPPPTAAPQADAPDCLCPGWTRQADLPIDGEMVNLIWEGSPDIGVQIRSHGGDGWSAWEDAHLEADESPDAGTEGLDDDRHVLGPVWTGPGTDQIELYLESGEPRSLELEVLHSVIPEGWDPGAPSPAPAGAPGGIDVARPTATQPVIFNRGQWGAGPWRSDHAGCDGGPFYASNLRFGVVHHTVSTNSYSPGQAFSLVQGVYYTHTNTNGWCDIGYNFLVDKYGQTFEGRSMSLYGPVTGGHAKGFNSGSVGVALLGQYHPGASPPAVGVTGSQLASTAAVLAWKFDQYGIDPYGQTLEVSGGSTSIPAGQWVWLNRVSGHRDMGATACPGNNAYNLFPSLRADIQSRQVPTAFRDVPRNHVFYDEIDWMWRNGLANGFSDGTFRPQNWVLRQELMLILHRFAASPAGPFPNPGFTDIPINHFAYKAIAWAAHRDIVGPYPNGSFQPLLWVSREAMVAFLYRLASSPPGPFPNPGLRDVRTNHEYYKEISWAVHNNVVDGFPDDTFRGGDPVSRQFSAAFMQRYAQLF